jgi:membrane protein implicated in regulation of membrane protease activity
MTGLDWNMAAISVSATAIAAVIVVLRGLRRRTRRQTTARAHPLGERRIDVVAIDEGRSSPKQDPFA